MDRVIVKVQLPIYGQEGALIYDEGREFLVLVDDPDSFENIALGQDGALIAYWHADIDYKLRTFKLVSRAPEQDW